MGLEPAYVGLEPVDFEAGLLERQRDEILHGALVAGHRWDADEILRQLDAGVGVQGFQRPSLCPFPDHGVSVMGSGGEVEGAVAVGIADAAQEDAVFATFGLDRRPALWAVPEHHQEVRAIDQLELGHLARKFSGLRRKDTRGHEEALHQFARRDNANQLADLTGLGVTAGASTLLALAKRPVFSLATG